MIFSSFFYNDFLIVAALLPTPVRIVANNLLLHNLLPPTAGKSLIDTSIIGRGLVYPLNYETV
jgi:hypothetical protein